jgi:8-oxo-dGTP diphosphatase / 2-hydroxy-dATP diphosphatase
MERKILTLCIVHDQSRVLLGMKKRGFGEGRWNGFGGKVESGERIEAAAKRELLEEVGIRAAKVEKFGKINFKFKDDPVVLEVNIFKTSDFEGKPTESDEMKPKWFHVDKIPFDKMWPDDKYWLPHLLAGKKIKGKFVFQGQDKILDYKLELI